MHSIIDKYDNHIGIYIAIKDDEYSSRIFTRFYNMCIYNRLDNINEQTVRDLIKMDKYDLDNSIPVYDLKNNNIVLSRLKAGLYMIFMYKENKLYLSTEEELKQFLSKNNYTSSQTINYVIGIPTSDGKFIKVRPIASNNVKNAKEVYKNRYNIMEDPIIIGIKELSTFHINLNDHDLSAKIDEDDIIK